MRPVRAYLFFNVELGKNRSANGAGRNNNFYRKERSMTVGQMKDFLKDLNEDLEILVKIPSPTQKDGLWEPLDGMNIKVEPQPTGK
jgi:hypothetical protein